MTREEALNLKEGDFVLCIEDNYRNNSGRITGNNSSFTRGKIYEIGGKYYKDVRQKSKFGNAIAVKKDDRDRPNGWRHEKVY